MTNIKIFKDNKDNFKGITVQGHTDTNVCAAISALSLTLTQALKNIKDVEFVRLEYEKYIDIEVKPRVYQKITTKRINNIFETICTGYAQLQQTYPDKLNLEFVI